MPDESLIHVDRARAVEPATHVLVIGVGHYDHLPGGGGAPTGHAEGMGQLSSPGASARAVAAWFLSGAFDNPERPLGSVAVAMSDASTRTVRVGAREMEAPAADSSGVSRAVEEWFERCNANPENMAVLYFCGHGVASGSRMALILQDFGSKEANPYAGALDLIALLTAMETCRASRQVFFIDACRVSSAAMAGTDMALGQKPLMPDVRRRLDLGAAAAQQTYYATLPGEAAYARTGRPSVFAEAVLWSLGGGGASDEDGEWWTTSFRLLEAIDFFAGRSRVGGSGTLQRPESSRQSLLRVNRVNLDPAYATAYVSLEDREAWALASLSHSSDAGTLLQAAAGQALSQKGLPDWEVRMSPGIYRFGVTWVMDAPYSAHSIKVWVVPPYNRVTLKVRP
jgi:hypothetical protein